MTMTDTDRVLNFWHSVEFFNAYDLEKPLESARQYRTAALVNHDNLHDGTWETYASRRRVLYLVPFDVAQVSHIVEAYIDGPSSDDKTRARDGEMAAAGLTCFAKLSVNPKGEPDFNGLSLSALPWALGKLAGKDMDALCAEAFEASVAKLKHGLLDEFSQQEEKILGPAFLLRMCELLQAWASFSPQGAGLAYLDIYAAEKSRSSSKEGSSTPDETETDDGDERTDANDVPILNSFYVHDLAQAKRALKSSAKPRALAAYLAGVDQAKLDLDSEAGQREVLETLRPRHGISGRWPSDPKHVQSLMQQFALNKMQAMSSGDILAVNGPPGTGKTTLLRDLIAHLIVQRADALSKLHDAKQGLSGEINAVFGSNTHKIPLLSPALTGFEIVVASTNNGAVENLSLELPQLEGIDAQRVDTLHYFKEVATKYAGSRGDKAWVQPSPVWGLVSAALGKKANRTRFSDVFSNRARTPSDKPGSYLDKDKVDQGSWDNVGAMTFWRYKSEKKSARSFQAAKQRYLQARLAYEKERGQLEVLDQVYTDLRQRWAQVKNLWPAAPQLDTTDIAPLAEGMERLVQRLQDNTRSFERQLGPAWLRWLVMWFRKGLYQQWCDSCDALAFVRAFANDLTDLRRLIGACGVYLWDGTPLDSQANQQHAFWQGKRFNDTRSELFAAAMALHEAFFLEAATADVVMALSRMLSRPPLPPARHALWRWFFMLTPVVSSTFASIRAQFAGLESEALGWLVIDEAGQAPPQAAVGAIMRAARVVIVGDPLQIEPVVTQSTRLLNKLGTYWLGSACPRYAVDNHSVQTLADRAYAFGVR
ncbi:AAA domain-containing protein, partial [Dyella silvatica]|uniref:AAA domain-containing protein n=1 Tax=Dyella silvatica TaxID=2992128 RepID=UPI002250EA72